MHHYDIVCACKILLQIKKKTQLQKTKKKHCKFSNHLIHKYYDVAFVSEIFF
jgi:hypothetical protein